MHVPLLFLVRSSLQLHFAPLHCIYLHHFQHLVPLLQLTPKPLDIIHVGTSVMLPPFVCAFDMHYGVRAYPRKRDYLHCPSSCVAQGYATIRRIFASNGTIAPFACEFPLACLSSEAPPTSDIRTRSATRLCTSQTLPMLMHVAALYLANNVL